MQTDQLISIKTFCNNYKLEFSFIETLNDYGLVEITTINQIAYIEINKITTIEKMIRLHDDLNINMEGLDVIHHLLKKIEHLNNENNTLKNRIDFYENL